MPGFRTAAAGLNFDATTPPCSPAAFPATSPFVDACTASVLSEPSTAFGPLSSNALSLSTASFAVATFSMPFREIPAVDNTRFVRKNLFCACTPFVVEHFCSSPPPCALRNLGGWYKRDGSARSKDWTGYEHCSAGEAVLNALRARKESSPAARQLSASARTLARSTLRDPRKCVIGNCSHKRCTCFWFRVWVQCLGFGQEVHDGRGIGNISHVNSWR